MLELQACQLGLLSLFQHKTNIHIKIYMDNTTSVSYVNKYGGQIDALNRIARDIWFWCIERNIFLLAHHVCRKMYCTADKLSRSGNDDLEWGLSTEVFTVIHVCQSFPSLLIICFAP